MVESEADEVTLQGVTSVGLKHALDFAYTGQVSVSNSYHSWTDKEESIAYRNSNAITRKSEEKTSHNVLLGGAVQKHRRKNPLKI